MNRIKPVAVVSIITFLISNFLILLFAKAINLSVVVKSLGLSLSISLIVLSLFSGIIFAFLVLKSLLEFFNYLKSNPRTLKKFGEVDISQLGEEGSRSLQEVGKNGVLFAIFIILTLVSFKVLNYQI